MLRPLTLIILNLHGGSSYVTETGKCYRQDFLPLESWLVNMQHCNTSGKDGLLPEASQGSNPSSSTCSCATLERLFNLSVPRVPHL